MSEQAGGSAAQSEPTASVAVGDAEPTSEAGSAPALAAPWLTPGTPVLALLALGWLAAMLWSTREAINSAAAGITALSLSAFALPG